MAAKNVEAKAWSIVPSSDGKRWSAYPAGDKSTAVFPLSVSANGRYLQKADGSPFFFFGDAAWSMAVQLTPSQIDQYLDDRASRGFTATLFNAIESDYSSQTPRYRNVSGVDPFSSMSTLGNTPTEAYWARVDYIVNGCLSRGMAVVINPAYFGATGETGWDGVVDASSNADLDAYGAFLAARYTQGNIIWCMGGDDPGTTPRRDKQYRIITALRAAGATLWSGHAAEGTAAYTYWSGYTGFNVNFSYPGQNVDYVYDWLATEYARAGPIPVVMFEAGYEAEFGFPTASMVRAFAYTSWLSGACGAFYGNNPVWNFEGSPVTGYSGTWQTNLNSTGAQDMARVAPFFTAYQWWKLEPKTDASLVTTSLGTGTGRVCPALASDGTFAMIWTPTVNVTVAMSQFSIGSVRGRWFSPSDGTYTAASGSPYANSGTQSFTAPGERILVLDAP